MSKSADNDLNSFSKVIIPENEAAVPPQMGPKNVLLITF